MKCVSCKKTVNITQEQLDRQYGKCLKCFIYHKRIGRNVKKVVIQR